MQRTAYQKNKKDTPDLEVIHERSTCNFSFQYQYIFKQTGDKN